MIEGWMENLKVVMVLVEGWVNGVWGKVKDVVGEGCVEFMRFGRNVLEGYLVLREGIGVKGDVLKWKYVGIRGGCRKERR